MKYVITESQYKLIYEKVERTWRDKEYEHQYPKLSSKLIPIVSNMIESYGEGDDNRIFLNDSDGKTLILYVPYRHLDKISRNGEIYYSRELDKLFESFLPHPLWLIHGKYIIQDVFNQYFPENNVVDIRSVVFV